VENFLPGSHLTAAALGLRAGADAWPLEIGPVFHFSSGQIRQGIRTVK